jgi:hypothetical protein
MRNPCLILALSALTLPTLGGQTEAALRAPAPAVAPAGRPVERGQGIRWQKSLAAAKAMAARTGKPLFLLHLFGKLDQEFC